MTDAAALEARLADARHRRERARGGEWVRARAEEEYLAEALFGLGGGHVTFNPNQHPRDRTGAFSRVLGGLQHGDTAHLPGGVAVTRTHAGFKIRHARELAPDVGKRVIADPKEAAAAAIREDPTPRENHRIEGAAYREGAPLSLRDAHALAKGTPVVANGEYGRYVGTRVAPGATRRRVAVVEFDHPSEDGRKVRKNADPGRLRLAHRVDDPEGRHSTHEPYSPGRTAGQFVTINPGGDALHFIHDAMGAVDRRTEADRKAMQDQFRRAGIAPLRA